MGVMFDQSKTINQKNAHYGLKSGKILTLDNVGVNFKNFNALSTIQMEIGQGEILFITGASGAGKTTLLRVLSGQLQPTKGRVQLLRPNAHMALVFQDLRLIENYSCEMNLMMAYDNSIYKNKNEFVYEMIEFANILKIRNRLNLKIKDANGGLKQKVAILRALLSRPDVIFLDEPTSSLDQENALKIFELLNFLNVKKGLTVVWASHDRDLIRSFSGRIIHLDGGRLIHAGHACFI